jgi:hypothetical protein
MFVHPNKINFIFQVKYGVDLHAVYRFGRDRLMRALNRVSSWATAVMAGGSVRRPRPEDNI